MSYWNKKIEHHSLTLTPTSYKTISGIPISVLHKIVDARKLVEATPSWEYVIIDMDGEPFPIKDLRETFNVYHVKIKRSVMIIKDEETAIRLRLSIPDNHNIRFYKIAE